MTCASERIENEMRIAQMIQQQLLPRSLPQVAGWDFDVHYHPAARGRRRLL